MWPYYHCYMTYSVQLLTSENIARLSPWEIKEYPNPLMKWRQHTKCVHTFAHIQAQVCLENLPLLKIITNFFFTEQSCFAANNSQFYDGKKSVASSSPLLQLDRTADSNGVVIVCHRDASEIGFLFFIHKLPPNPLFLCAESGQGIGFKQGQ